MLSAHLTPRAPARPASKLKLRLEVAGMLLELSAMWCGYNSCRGSRSETEGAWEGQVFGEEGPRVMRGGEGVCNERVREERGSAKELGPGYVCART